MRICHVLSSFNVGGAERVALRLAAAQANAHDVTIVALQGGPLEVEARESGVRVRVFEGKIAGKVLKCAIEFASCRYDIVNSHNRWAQKYAAFARTSKVVMTLHAECRIDYGWGVRRPWIDGVIAVSKRAAETFRALHPDVIDKYPLATIINGVEAAVATKHRTLVRSELGLGEERLIINVARHDPFKNLDLLLRAFQRVCQGVGSCHLLMVGDGESRSELEQLARDLGISKSVTFLGMRSDVPDLLNASDVFALSSKTEGMPIAVLEAMATGLPVVSTAVGGVPEVVDDGVTGALVPAGDSEALAMALQSLVCKRDSGRTLGEAGRHRVAAAFSLDAMVAKYESFYEQVRSSPLASLRTIR